MGESLKAGADVVTFSGDKLLGGPQAGIILGKKDLIEKIRRNPLARAVRIDKLTLAALEAVLRIYRDDPADAAKKIPVLAMLTAAPSDLKRRAQKLAEMIRREVRDRAAVSVQPEQSQAGGGAPAAWESPDLCRVRPPGGRLRLARRGAPPGERSSRHRPRQGGVRPLRPANSSRRRLPVVAQAVGRALGKRPRKPESDGAPAPSSSGRPATSITENRPSSKRSPAPIPTG